MPELKVGDKIYVERNEKILKIIFIARTTKTQAVADDGTRFNINYIPNYPLTKIPREKFSWCGSRYRYYLENEKMKNLQLKEEEERERMELVGLIKKMIETQPKAILERIYDDLKQY